MISNKFTAEQLLYIKENYLTSTQPKMAKHLKCSVASIGHVCAEQGWVKYKNFSTDEDRILRKYDNLKCLELLPHRTIQAIKNRKYKLGIKDGLESRIRNQS